MIAETETYETGWEPEAIRDAFWATPDRFLLEVYGSRCEAGDLQPLVAFIKAHGRAPDQVILKSGRAVQFTAEAFANAPQTCGGGAVEGDLAAALRRTHYREIRAAPRCRSYASNDNVLRPLRRQRW